MVSHSDSLAGRELAGYRLLLVLGAGDASTVYLAQRVDAPTTLVAVKVLSPSGMRKLNFPVNFRERFVREAWAIQRLGHPHILPIISYGEEGDLSYLVLPFVPGGTLAHRLATAPHGLPLAQVASYLDQIAAAVDFAHAHGVVHGGITPSNMLVGAEGDISLADLGIARLLSTPDDVQASTAIASFTTAGQARTLHYVAPEQLTSTCLGPAADVYALGVVLYQMATGAVPFDAGTPTDLAMAHLFERPRRPRGRRTDLPATAEAAILRALAKSPIERFHSAGELAYAFRKGLQATRAASLSLTGDLAANTLDSAPLVAAAPPPMGATPLPTLAAAPPTPITPPAPHVPHTPHTAGPIMAEHPRHAAQTQPPVSIPRRRGISRVLAGALVLGLLLVGVFGAQAARIGYGSHGTSHAPSAGTVTIGHAHTPTVTPTTPTAVPAPTPRVPAGATIFSMPTGGNCDTNGASWANNSAVTRSCQGGMLVMSVGQCDCPFGIMTLSSIHGKGYPTSYVAQASIHSMGNNPNAKWGFKFNQQSPDGSGSGQGGFSFLVDSGGQWQFVVYGARGTPHVYAQQQLPASVSDGTTLDLVVQGSTYSFYVNGSLVAKETDSLYPSGFFGLVATPGATVKFGDIALYQTA